MAITDNLIGYWRLDEASGSRADSSGTGNTLTEFGGTINSTAGKIVNCPDTLGYNKRLERATNTSLQMGDVDFTIAGWFYITEFTASRDLLRLDNGAAWDYDIYFSTPNGNKFTFYTERVSGGYKEVSSSISPVANTWYFVVAIHDSVNDTMSISVNNGTPVTITGVTGGTKVTTGATFRVGSDIAKIDECGIWKRVLSASEITQIYNSGDGLSYPFTPLLLINRTEPIALSEAVKPAVLLTDLVAYWKLDETAGTLSTTWADSTGNGNTLIVSSATTPVNSRTGKISSGVDLVPVNNSWPRRATNSFLNMGDTDFSITCWVYLDATFPAFNIISKDNGSKWDYEIYYNSSDQKLHFYFDDPVSGSVDVGWTADLVAAGAWYFVVGVHDSANNLSKISVNGGPFISISTGSRVPIVTTGNFNIGSDNIGSGRVDGVVDEVGVWKRCLGPTELARLYNQGAGRSYPFTGALPTGLWYSCGAYGLSSVGWASSASFVNSNTGMVDMYGYPQFKPPTGPVYNGDVSFNSITQLGPKQFKYTIDWGYVTATYSDSGNKLYLDLDIRNDSADLLVSLGLRLLSPTFSGAMTKWQHEPGWQGNGGNGAPNNYPLAAGYKESPALLGFNTPDCVVNVCADIGMMDVQLYTSGSGDQTTPVFSGYISNVPAGTTKSVRWSFRFYAPGSDMMLKESDIEVAFRTLQPQLLHWTDHRPIAMMFLASSGVTAYPANFNKWIVNGGNVDCSTPGGLTAFQNQVLAMADTAVSITTSHGAQGMILWDIEGQRDGPTYYGAPELCNEITEGEIESMVTVGGVSMTLAKAYFKKFTDAGLRVGVCIRPSDCHYDPGTTNPKYWTNVQAATEAEALADMTTSIQYAIDNWGCSLFYIDSTVTDDPAGMQYIGVDTWKALRATFPNVLLCPENQMMGSYSQTAPLDSYAHTGFTKTQDKVRRVWPGAFMINICNTTIVPEDEAAIQQGMREGDIYMFNGWYNSPVADKIYELYSGAFPPVDNAARNKRAMAIGIDGLYRMVLPLPDGTIDVTDRWQITGKYRITAAPPAALIFRNRTASRMRFPTLA
jgi:Concanavalin A-like lectin/glucanases superfamily